MSEEAIEPEEEDAAVSDTDESVSELMSPMWSVICFNKCVASGLSYDEATQEINKRTNEGLTGLCIVTDEAGARMKKPSVL